MLKRRQVFGSDGTEYTVEDTAAGLEIREKGKQGYLVPWGRVFLLGAQIKADQDRAESGRTKRITRGLLSTR